MQNQEKIAPMNLFAKQKQRHRYTEQIYGPQRGKEEDKLEDWD